VFCTMVIFFENGCYNSLNYGGGALARGLVGFVP